MAYRRRAAKRGGRRFFRRRRMRTTTEQGGRWERAFFNINNAVPVSQVTPDAVQDAIKIVGGGSLIAPLATAGTQAAAVARALEGPMRGYAVAALQFDVDVWLDPGWNLTAVELEGYPFVTVRGGFAVYTQRLTSAYSPTNIPNYHLSQWPIEQAAAPTNLNEDADYATRTHYHRAFTLAPSLVSTFNVVDFYVVDSNPHRHIRFSRIVKIKRVIPDDYALFFGMWNQPLVAPPGSTTNMTFEVTGSLWYRMLW